VQKNASTIVELSRRRYTTGSLNAHKHWNLQSELSSKEQMGQLLGLDPIDREVLEALF